MSNKRVAETISVIGLLDKIGSDNNALKFLENILWSNGRKCNRCNGKDKITSQSDGINYWCGRCRKYFNVKTNTPLERTKIPIRKWILTIYSLVTSRKSVSSLQLSKELGITQKSAWFLMHRIRECCNNDFGMLSGIVEVDETYIGGLEKNKHSNKRVKGTQGRSTKTKDAVVGIRERGGRVKAQSIENLTGNKIQDFLRSNIILGSTISTDEARFYKSVRGYSKMVVNHSVGEFVNGMASTNGIESVWAVLKRGYHGTFHHFSKKHLDRYINEFTFRLNEGKCEIDTMDRITSLVKNAKSKRITYKDLIGK